MSASHTITWNLVTGPFRFVLIHEPFFLFVCIRADDGRFAIEEFHEAGQAMLETTSREIELEFSPPPVARTGRTVHAANEDRTMQVRSTNLFHINCCYCLGWCICGIYWQR